MINNQAVGGAMRDAIKEMAGNIAETNQNSAIALHRKHIQAIWRHLERLEQFIKPNAQGELSLVVGDASITLKRNGDIRISGHNIVVDGFGRVTIKAVTPSESF